MTDNKLFDVIIVGGSYAGLSAAMSLGRSLRKVLVIDAGKPCNRQTPHSHNFLTQDGKAPAEIAAISRKQVEAYETVKFLSGFAAAAEKIDGGFSVTSGSGEFFTARKLILATGIDDMLPAIPGFSECWGISVVHCPYCHGYEASRKKTAVLANGERAFHIASLVNNLTDDLTILTNGKPDFDAIQMEKLTRNGIDLMEIEVSEIFHENGRLKSIAFVDGSVHDFEVLYAAVPFRQQSEIPASLGCERTESGHIKTDPLQKTTIEGVFACGDNSNMMRSVALAVSSGNVAGAVVNGELTKEMF